MPYAGRVLLHRGGSGSVLLDLDRVGGDDFVLDVGQTFSYTSGGTAVSISTLRQTSTQVTIADQCAAVKGYALTCPS